MAEKKERGHQEMYVCGNRPTAGRLDNEARGIMNMSTLEKMEYVKDPNDSIVRIINNMRDLFQYMQVRAKLSDNEEPINYLDELMRSYEYFLRAIDWMDKITVHDLPKCLTEKYHNSPTRLDPKREELDSINGGVRKIAQ